MMCDERPLLGDGGRQHINEDHMYFDCPTLDLSDKKINTDIKDYFSMFM